jgi:type IV pilus assembly protein PilF
VSGWLASALLLMASLLSACAPTAGSLAGGPAASVGRDSDARRRAEIRIELATNYYADGRMDLAMAEIIRALDAQPSNAEALGLKGLVLLQMGDAKQGEQSLQQAVRLEPDNPRLLNNLGWLVCQSGEPQRALPYFERALVQRGYASPATALANAGLCSLRAGDLRSAEANLVRASSLDPSLPTAQDGLAQLAFARADYVAARHHVARVLNSRDATPEHFLMAVRVERLLGDKAAEQSLLTQWRRRYPESQQLHAYLRGESDEQ